ncbi:cytochrome P450 [Scleroderma yunnanense]
MLRHVYDKVPVATRSVTVFDAAAVIAAFWTLRIAIRVARRTFKTTRLRGPPRKSLIFGASKDLLKSSDAGSIYEGWAKEYGPVYEVPTTLGGNKIVLCDPKSIAHYYSRETWTYVLLPSTTRFIKNNLGRGILWAQGETHKRQRKSLTPAFSHAAIRDLIPIFYSSAYKAKDAWESLIDTNRSDSTIIEVQNWLDTIGLAGFSHDFGSLDGKPASVTKIFDAFSSSNRSAIHVGLFLLTQVFPVLSYVPTPRKRLMEEMQDIIENISKTLLERTRTEKEQGVLDGKKEKSVIGVLIKANDTDTAELHLTREEVLAQMKVLLFAGYETTSISLTWALLELARNPNIQSKLRKELIAFGVDPTYDQLNNSLPYLDAVVHETLRLHPPLPEFTRVAIKDDVIPVSESVRTKSGDFVDSIAIARGTQITIPIACINRSTAIWGTNAKLFLPERWLEEGAIPKEAQEVQGYRHLLTFADGPRTCLGKGFAVAEFKIVLSVLVKSFIFEMRDGPDTQVGMGRGMLPRPKVAGEEGTRMPLRVSRYDQ